MYNVFPWTRKLSALTPPCSWYGLFGRLLHFFFNHLLNKNRMTAHVAYRIAYRISSSIRYRITFEESIILMINFSFQDISLIVFAGISSPNQNGCVLCILPGEYTRAEAQAHKARDEVFFSCVPAFVLSSSST